MTKSLISSKDSMLYYVDICSRQDLSMWLQLTKVLRGACYLHNDYSEPLWCRLLKWIIIKYTLMFLDTGMSYYIQIIDNQMIDKMNVINLIDYKVICIMLFHWMYLHLPNIWHNYCNKTLGNFRRSTKENKLLFLHLFFLLWY